MDRLRTASVVVIALMAYALFLLVWGTPGEPVPERTEGVSVDWDAAKDDESKKLEITWMGRAGFPTGKEDGYIETMLQSRFNIEIKPIFLSPDQFDKKKPLMLASGDVPDVISEGAMVLQRDAYHGFLLEIPYEVILKHAPRYVEGLNRYAPLSWLPAVYKGRNYGVPTRYINGLYPGPGLWRKDWLENVGIHKVPETLEEMYAAFKKITHEDPDGDGKDDTYGMTADMQLWWWTSFSEIFGAFGVLPYDWMERDGKIVWGGILPETRQALALLRRWYRDGIIDPGFATDRFGAPSSVQQKFVNGRLGYIYYLGRYVNLDLTQPTSLYSKLRKFDPGAELVPAAFPKGPQGKRGGRVWGPDGGVVAFGRHLAKEPEKVIRVLKMLDAMAADEHLHIEAKLGRRGEHWDYLDPQVGPGSGVRLLPPYDDRHVADRAVVRMLLVVGGFFCPDSLDPPIADKYTPREELKFRTRYRKLEWGMQDALGKPDYLPSSAQYRDDLQRMQQSAFTEIIRGDSDLYYFQTFVQDWKAQGGDILTEEANELNELKKKIFRKVGITEKD